MELTAEERVYMTSFGRDLDGFLEEKMASKASGLEFDGTEVVTDIGRWVEKKDATWTSTERYIRTANQMGKNT